MATIEERILDPRLGPLPLDIAAREAELARRRRFLDPTYVATYERPDRGRVHTAMGLAIAVAMILAIAAIVLGALAISGTGKQGPAGPRGPPGIVGLNTWLNLPVYAVSVPEATRTLMNATISGSFSQENSFGTATIRGQVTAGAPDGPITPFTLIWPEQMADYNVSVLAGIYVGPTTGLNSCELFSGNQLLVPPAEDETVVLFQIDVLLGPGPVGPTSANVCCPTVVCC